MDARDESPKSSDAEAKKDLYDGQPSATEVISVHSGSSDYRLYKRRFVGLVGLESLKLSLLLSPHLPPGRSKHRFRDDLALVRADIK